jgi:histone H3/H4
MSRAKLKQIMSKRKNVEESYEKEIKREPESRDKKEYFVKKETKIIEKNNIEDLEDNDKNILEATEKVLNITENKSLEADDNNIENNEVSKENCVPDIEQHVQFEDEDSENEVIKQVEQPKHRDDSDEDEYREKKNTRKSRNDSDEDECREKKNTRKSRNDSDEEDNYHRKEKYEKNKVEFLKDDRTGRRSRGRPKTEDRKTDDRKTDKKGRYEEQKYEEEDVISGSDETKPFSHVPKSIMSKLLKSLNVNSGPDMVEAMHFILNEIVYTIFFKILGKKVDNVITLNDLKNLISNFVDEDELPEDLFLSQKQFETGIKNVCNDCKCVLKREAVAYTHLFTEYLLVKMVDNANLIATNAKRYRISGKDVLLALKISMGN